MVSKDWQIMPKPYMAMVSEPNIDINTSVNHVICKGWFVVGHVAMQTTRTSSLAFPSHSRHLIHRRNRLREVQGPSRHPTKAVQLMTLSQDIHTYRRNLTTVQVL